ncbi:MAG: glycosyltransferase family 2 protein [Candidatus Melainabacteria bacterium]|nr:glycosyltransferase family 2 protein [Candidatus Melainabacteria bacterium]
MKSQIGLSVLVCTRNRARQLATLIQCLGTQTNIEKLNWEIVIVDNNSNDNTKEVAYAFCEGSNLKVNYLFEPKIGLSNARNSGILASKGSLILFVDDDVLIPKEFISSVLFGVQEFPEFDIFGFRILPDWQENLKPPFWLIFKKPLNLPINLIQSFLPIHDLGKEILQYPNRITKNPIGACFLVKKGVFEKLGPFRDDLGAGQSGVCEDTEFFWYAMINNFKILYWPYAALYHPVDPKRLTITYLHKWYFNLGRSLYLIKSKGRINKEFPASSSCLLYFKLFILILLLPFSIILLIFKRPFYLSTLLAKTFGEINQLIKSTKSS